MFIGLVQVHRLLYSFFAVFQPMPRRSKKSRRSSRSSGLQLNVERHVMREIWAVIYMSLCVLTILSLNGKLGVVGQVWNSFLTPIFGWGLYLVPVILGGVSLALFFARRVLFDATRTFGVILMLVAALGTLHLSVPEADIYEVAKVGQYGGYVGFVSSFIARQVLGVTGAYVVFLSLLIISILLTFSVSLREIAALFRWGGRGAENRKQKTEWEQGSGGQEDESLENMVIHMIKSKVGEATGRGKEKEEVVYEFDEDEEETLKLRKVEPEGEGEETENRRQKTEWEQGEQEAENQEDEFSEGGEAIPVERIAEELEAAEAQAEIVEEDVPWEFPSLDLLSSAVADVELDQEVLMQKAEAIRDKLAQFDIPVKMHDVHVGPTVIQYTLKPHEGVKLSKITALKNDLALALAASAIRIEAPIPGKAFVGIEVPNDTRTLVTLRELFESPSFIAEQKKSKSKLVIPLGRDVSGYPWVADLAKMPHLLVAGATGSGKSVATNAMLMSFLYQNSPRDLKLILVDPKQVELTPYNGIPHLLTPVITEPDKAAIALRWVVAEMTRRYTVCADAGHRNIEDYNGDPNSPQRMPRIVVLIDELADLMMVAGKEVEASICRIAQMARAVGIHLIVATQRPSVDVITGLIKANIPARIAFTVASSIDSRTILDGGGAEDLLGQGDMLYVSGTMGKPVRIQGVFVSTEEVQKVTNRVKLTLSREPLYNNDITARKTAGIKVTGVPESRVGGEEGEGDDEALYVQALEIVKRTQKASATMLQRHLKVGYSRAARLIDMLEENGVVGPAQGAKPREVFVEREEI